MKSRFLPFLVGIPIITGACGAALRAGQLTYAFDAETGVLESGSPLTLWLIAVSIFAVLAALVCAIVLKNGVESEGCSSGKLATLSSVIAAVLIIAYAGVTVFALQKEFDAAKLVFALLTAYCAAALLILGKYRFAERDSTAYCVFAAVPVFWACFLIILTFRDKITDPIIADYAIGIFAYICILFFLYALAAHLLGKSRFGVMMFSCFAGVYFIIIELFSPIIARFIMSGSAEVTFAAIGDCSVQLAFLIFMPCVTLFISRKKKKQ